MTETNRTEPNRTEPAEQLDAEGDELAPMVGQASVWGDAWRYLRTNPLFLLGLTVMVVMITMALFPALFARGSTHPPTRPVALRRPPSREHWFRHGPAGLRLLRQRGVRAQTSWRSGGAGGDRRAGDRGADRLAGRLFGGGPTRCSPGSPISSSASAVLGADPVDRLPLSVRCGRCPWRWWCSAG